MAILNVDAGVTCWSHRPSCVNIRSVAASATVVHTGFALTVDMNSADVMATQTAARFDIGASNSVSKSPIVTKRLAMMRRGFRSSETQNENDERFYTWSDRNAADRELRDPGPLGAR